MDKIIGVIGGIPENKTRNDDDFSDRLSYRYTSSILILFAIVVSTTQFVGEPISCWVPAHFTDNHAKYTDQYCWVANTYFLAFSEYIPKQDGGGQEITYYQWMPMILLVQALFFYLPCNLWRRMNSHSGIDLHSIVASGEAFQNAEMEEDTRDKTLHCMTQQMDRYLSIKKQAKVQCTVSIQSMLMRTCCRTCGRRHGNYLVVLYLICKCIYIANVTGQIFALSIFLGYRFHTYGIDAISLLVSGQDMGVSPRFPRVTMCNFLIRRLGNVQRYTVQCVLPINLFNEMIYLFLWFWMVFVAIMACFSLLVWVKRIALPRDRRHYVKKHLLLMKNLQHGTDNEKCTEFIDKYLKQDGVFVLRLVGHNTNAITVTEFVCSLWDNFKKKP